MPDVSLAQIAVLVVGLLAAGAVTGLLAGVFGVGGGAIIVPVLVALFHVLNQPDEIATPLAVGTSLAIIIPTSIRSFRAHLKKGAVDMSILRAWAVPVVIGVIVGSLIARYAPPGLFKGVFVFVAGLSAIRLLFLGDGFKLGDTMPTGPLMIAYGWLIGLLSSLMGIGGGQLSNLFMTFYGRPIHQAIATSSGLGVLISIPGAIGAMYAGAPKMGLVPTVANIGSIGFVSVAGALLVVPTSMWTAPLGAALAHRMSRRKLEVAFGVFLILVSANFAWQLLTR